MQACQSRRRRALHRLLLRTFTSELPVFGKPKHPTSGWVVRRTGRGFYCMQRSRNLYGRSTSCEGGEREGGSSVRRPKIMHPPLLHVFPATLLEFGAAVARRQPSLSVDFWPDSHSNCHT